MIKFFGWFMVFLGCWAVSWLSYIEDELYYLMMMPASLLCLWPMWDIARNPIIRFINIFLRMYYRARWPEFHPKHEKPTPATATGTAFAEITQNNKAA